jgi:hypothetical protein
MAWAAAQELTRKCRVSAGRRVAQKRHFPASRRPGNWTGRLTRNLPPGSAFHVGCWVGGLLILRVLALWERIGMLFQNLLSVRAWRQLNRRPLLTDGSRVDQLLWEGGAADGWTA